MLGNDKYNILNATSDSHGPAAGFVANDYVGNDTYNIAKLNYTEAILDSTYDIIDLTGNDKYNMKKVVVKNKNKTTSIFNLNVQNVAISDSAGNDKYAITISDTIDVASNIVLSDDKGADTYTVKGIETNTVDYLTIYDNNTSSKDKYNIAWTTDLDIEDMGGNDTYTLTKCDGSILDKGGSDKYTVNAMSNWDVVIADSGDGKDSYKVNATAKQSFVEINDAGGSKDSLVLSGAKKNDIVFMVDIKNDNTYRAFDGKLQLLAYNKTTDSLVVLDDFYAASDDTTISGFSTGRIETVKAGSTTLKDANKAETYATFNALVTKGEVAAWLGNHSKGSVYQIMTTSDASADPAKAAMVAFFSGETPQA